MGMFDRLYDKSDREWQTKAFNCTLQAYGLGQAIDGAPSAADDWGVNDVYQVEVLAGNDHISPEYVESYATIRGGVLTEIPAERNVALPLLNYGGSWATVPNG